MHRHGYAVAKLGRERDQRRALIRGMATSLIERESIETTLPKAKALKPYVERLITKAKKGDLHNRRQVIAKLDTLDAAHKLVDDLAPKLVGRTSGHLRIEKTRFRRGDNAQMARLSFVDDLSKPASTPKPAAKPKTAKKTGSTKNTATAKKETK